MMSNLEMMRKRLEFQGGIKQEDRMIKGKYFTFLKTLQYAYQGCDVMLVQPREVCIPAEELDAGMKVYQQHRALINPDKTKQDYDDKVLSIDYQAGFKPGDVFQWINTNTHWIIYLKALTEDAYFRGEIRRCRYQIQFKDDKGNVFKTWAAIRGPVETQIDSIQKNQVRIDRPNWSLNILMPQNEYTLKMFDRYSEFMFAGKCWRVNATDTISMDGIIEINAEEYYMDRDTDTKELKNALVIEQVDKTPDTDIVGASFIKPKIAEIYKAPEQGGQWCVAEYNKPVKIIPKTNFEVEVIWDKTTSGEFTLQWSKGDRRTEKAIVVESLM